MNENDDNMLVKVAVWIGTLFTACSRRSRSKPGSRLCCWSTVEG